MAFMNKILNCLFYSKSSNFQSFADIKFMSGGSVLTLWWLYDDDGVINDDDVDGDAVNNDNGDAFVDDDWWWWCWCMGDRYKASPLSSLGVSQAPHHLLFSLLEETLDENYLRMTPSVFFDRLFNSEFGTNVHCDPPLIKHYFFSLKVIFPLSQAW